MTCIIFTPHNCRIRLLHCTSLPHRGRKIWHVCTDLTVIVWQLLPQTFHCHSLSKRSTRWQTSSWNSSRCMMSFPSKWSSTIWSRWAKALLWWQFHLFKVFAFLFGRICLAGWWLSSCSGWPALPIQQKIWTWTNMKHYYFTNTSLILHVSKL